MAALVGAALALAGCSLVPGGSLAGREFLSVGATDNGLDHPLVVGTRVRLTFTDSNVSASAGCNTMGGAYKLDGGRLLVDDLAMAEMGCPADLGRQDAWLATLLTAKPTVTLAGNDLTLSSGSATLRLLDRVVADPDRPLVGPTWVVTTLIDHDTASSVPQGLTATLVFATDGTVAIDTSCNSGSASWKAVAGGIQLDAPVLTKRACQPGPAALEAAIVQVLRAGTVATSIKAGSLTLTAGTFGLGLTAR